MPRHFYFFLLLISLPFWVNAQGLEPDPMPEFRWEYPIPVLSGQKVKTATVVDYKLWRQDSMMQTDGKTLVLREESAEKAEFEYSRAGLLMHALRIKSDRVVREADYETTWTYDANGRRIKKFGHFTSYADGNLFNADSVMYRYDGVGRLIEELFVEGPTILWPNDTLENRWRWRYMYADGGRKAKREFCIIKKLVPEDMSCSISVVHFDKEGRVLEIRMVDEEGNRPEIDGEPVMICQYDEAGRLVRKENYEYNSRGPTHTYTYDAAGRLILDAYENPNAHGREAWNEAYSYRADGLLEWLIRYKTQIEIEMKRYKVLYEFY